MTEALTSVPNVSDAGDTRFDGLRIRGFDASSDLYLDGVRDDAQYVRDLRNVERIEVLKGPAAVLYGRGSLGGVVNRISKKPGFGVESRLQSQIDNYGLRSILADIDRPVGERFAVRLNVGYASADSFRDEVNSKTWIVAPSILWQPSPDTSVLLQYEHDSNERLPDRGIPGLNGRPARVDISTYYGDPARDVINDRVDTIRGRISHRFAPAWELRYSGGYIALDNDFMNTYVTGVNATTLRVSRARFAQELSARTQTHSLELEGRFTTGLLRHHILLGAEALWQNRTPYLTTTAGAVPTLSLFNPDLTQQHVGPLVLSSDNDHRARNLGAFVQDQISLPGGIELVVGLRADRFRIRSRSRSATGVESVAARTTDTLSPRIGIVYTPTWATNHSAYATWTKGFAPVGAGTIGITPPTNSGAAAANALDPEKTRLFEVGLKSGWASQLETTLSVYDLDLYNRRTADPDRPGFVLLIGRQRSRGVEASIAGSVYGNFGLRGGVGYQDARILRDTPSSAGVSLAGNRPANIAKVNGSLFATYRPPAGLFAEAGVIFVGSRWADNANTVTLPGYERIDVMVGYRFKKFDIRAAVTNVADVVWYRTATSAGQIQPGNPRTATVSANYRF